MSKSFIYVKPSADPSRVKVLTELLEELEIPIYIQANADGTLVDADNPLATANTDRQTHNFARQEELLTMILLEMKLMNKYMSFGQDVELTDNDIEE